MTKCRVRTFSSRHLARFLKGTKARGLVSRPPASHTRSTTFRPFVRSGGEKYLLMEIPCGPRCCFGEGLSDYNPGSTIDRLRGRDDLENTGDFLHTLSCREEVRDTAGLAHLRGSPFSSLSLRFLGI